MKPLALGVVLGVLWLLSGQILPTTTAVLAAVVQPVTVAFVLGLAARPHLTRRRWSR